MGEKNFVYILLFFLCFYCFWLVVCFVVIMSMCNSLILNRCNYDMVNIMLLEIKWEELIVF